MGDTESLFNTFKKWARGRIRLRDRDRGSLDRIGNGSTDSRHVSASWGTTSFVNPNEPRQRARRPALPLPTLELSKEINLSTWNLRGSGELYVHVSG